MPNPLDAPAEVTLIGLGNILMRDEGVGVHAVRYIQEHCSIPAGLEIVDGGTTGLDLLPFIEGRRRVLFVDTVNFNQAPGFIGVLKNEAIPALFGAKESLHHMGLMDVLAAARLMDMLPDDIRLVGIQPEAIESGLELSPIIKGRFRPLVDRIVSEISMTGCACPEDLP
jgi:hydrogenase maturation protease